MNPAHLPALFRAQMQAQLGSQFPAFEAALTQPAPVSVRINPAKNRLDTTGLTPVPWLPELGFYLPERPVFTLDPLFQAGAYYVQEASSMLLADALRQTALAPGRPLRCLDLCAAPGGKSTLLASVLPAGSLLVCNEVIRSRVPILRENMDKWGYPNVVVANHDPDDFGALAGFFDVVVVDAPCSGEGLFRKDPDAVREWSADAVATCSARQRRILAAAASLVAEGGWLLYSTCTYNHDENGTNAQFLRQYGFESTRLTLPAEWGVVENEQATTFGYQCYPHRVPGEGFFISILRKTASRSMTQPAHRSFRSMRPVPARQLRPLTQLLHQPDAFAFYEKPNADVVAVPTALEKDLVLIDHALRSKGLGLEMGQFKGQDFVPAHALALSTAIGRDLPALALSKEDALRYFKKENPAPAEPVRGWLLAQYNGLNLGWLKGIGNRVNNYLPKDWRIRMDIKEYV